MDKGVAACSYTGLGHRRRHAGNEDAYVQFSLRGYEVMAVFDGISSHPGGAVASGLCAGVVRDVLEANLGRMSVKDAILSAVMAAHGELSRQQAEKPGLGKMGCTATLLCIDREGRTASVYSMGDSAAFRIRGRKIMKLTVDDSYCGEALDTGKMTPREARGFPDGFSLRQWMGRPGSGAPSGRFATWALLPGDEYLVCTDGLHAYLSRKRIRRIVKAGSGGREIVQQLYDTAILKGRSIHGERDMDDVTILYYHHPTPKGGGRPWKGLVALALLPVLLIGAYMAGVRKGRAIIPSPVRMPDGPASVSMAPDKQVRDTAIIEESLRNTDHETQTDTH